MGCIFSPIDASGIGRTKEDAITNLISAMKHSCSDIGYQTFLMDSARYHFVTYQYEDSTYTNKIYFSNKNDKYCAYI
jgi:hypothetical protein